MALFDDEPRSASVKALSDLHLLRLDQYIFDELMETHPEIAQGFINIMIERLRTVSHTKHVALLIGDALDSIMKGD
jgi:CRP-like cAMP-binding protein